MILSKLTDPRIYADLGVVNPMPSIMTKLRTHWVDAVRKGFIPLKLAKDTVGITQSMIDSVRGRPSTLDVFKPGVPYFTVFPKIHKLSVSELIPGVQLPFRLVTDLSKGPTSRADRFVAVNFLKDLQTDYCADLLQDSTMFLQKLDEIDRTLSISADHLLFNMDVEALYDSLRRNQVEMAIRHAITCCRPDWSEEFVDWLIESVNMSLYRCGCGQVW